MPSSTSQIVHVDYALVGGGLQNGLIALALLDRRPDISLAIVEREARLGGNHVWCFHGADLSPAMTAVIEPLIVRRWPGYQVRFPAYRRLLRSPYAALNSKRLDAAVQTALRGHPHAQRIHGEAIEVGAQRVMLADRRVVHAKVVIDARGPATWASATPTRVSDEAAAQPGTDRRHELSSRSTRPAAGCAYQKFLGVELHVPNKVPDSYATVMDACVPQTDGFRFLYTLPFAGDRVLVEDTYFSDTPDLDAPRIRDQVLLYAQHQGWGRCEVIREEQGVLPLPLHMGPEPPEAGPYRAGYGGGWFHPTTGYSLPAAARVAETVAQRSITDLPAAWTALWRRHRRQLRFALLLNRLLYRHFAPEQRWQVLERFYRLPESTVARFYALDMSLIDRLRIVCGRPPQGMSWRPIALPAGT